ncbi:MAG: exopolysaccharide transport family protein, partial [Elainellaceae cyanobacterium]
MEDKQYYAVEEIDFQNYWLLLRRRWLPALFVFSGCVILAGFYSTTRPSVYEATGKLLFQRSATSTLTGVGENLGQLQSLSFENSPLDTQAEIIKSDGIIQQAIANLNLQNEDGEPMLPGDIAGDLDLTAVDGTDILTVSYDSEDPQQAAALVNELMRLYIEDDIRSNRADAAAAREFIEQELPSAEATVNQAAEALRQFKDQNGIVELQNEAAVVVDAVAEMDQLVVAANAELADVSTRSIELAQQLNMTSEQAINISALSQSPGVQQALTSLQTIQAELTRQGARYTTEHPIIENLQLQEAEAEGLLQERVAQVVGNGVDIAPGQLQMGDVQEFLTQELVEAEVNRLSLASRVDSLLKTRNEYLSWSRAFPQLEKIQRQLENRLNAAQVNYEALLLRQQEVQLAENQTVGNARILDQAGVPLFPSSGSSKIYIVLGGIGGLMLGVAIAFLLDLFDRSLKTIKESQSLLGYSLLGLIPKYRLASSHQAPEGTDIATPLTQSFAEFYPVVADAYQMLQANLKFVSSDKRMKVIVVTSSVNREGRTSVSAQLA